MGQIFYACAYDIENKKCYTEDADKFHANCYSYSRAVLSMHYLLRQKPHHIMWGGGYVVIDDHIDDFSRESDLLGLSTYLDYDDFDRNNNDLKEKYYYKKVESIAEYGMQWEGIDIACEAMHYFDWNQTHSVTYQGYLINLTQKLAVDLADYYEQSRFFCEGIGAAIDPVPCLTETGGGLEMALFEGVSKETTETLGGQWCGDLLQIVEYIPEGYEVVNCCFANAKERVQYCRLAYGTNEDGYVFGDKEGDLFTAAALNIFGTRGVLHCFRVEQDENKIRYIPESSPK